MPRTEGHIGAVHLSTENDARPWHTLLAPGGIIFPSSYHPLSTTDLEPADHEQRWVWPPGPIGSQQGGRPVSVLSAWVFHGRCRGTQAREELTGLCFCSATSASKFENETYLQLHVKIVLFGIVRWDNGLGTLMIYYIPWDDCKISPAVNKFFHIMYCKLFIPLIS